MDKQEAGAILTEEVVRLRALPYERLLEYMEPRTVEVEGPSGTTYQIETQSLWDDKTERTVRVMVAIDDGRWSAFVPLTDDFIVAPDGTFVGE